MLYFCILGPSKLKSRNVRIQIRSCSYISMLLFSLQCFASFCWSVIYVASINNLIMIGLTCPVVLFLEIVLIYYFGPSMIHSHILCLKVSVDVLQESTNCKDCYLVWESVIIGVSACPCNSSRWSEAMHLSNIDPQWSFSSQILIIAFLWQFFFPYLKEAADLAAVTAFLLEALPSIIIQ